MDLGLNREEPVIRVGRIVGAYQATRLYDVMSERVRTWCTAITHGAATFGANVVTHYAAGEHVLFLLYPGHPNGFIIGRVDMFSAGQGNWEPHDSSLPTPVSGVVSGSYADIYRKNPRMAAYPLGPADATDGDWVVTNRLGAGISVEAFRVAIAGGPFSGLWLTTEDQQALLRGTKVRQVSVGWERQTGADNAGTLIERGWFDPDDYAAGRQPTYLRVAGVAAGGIQEFIGAPDGVNGADRPALIHELRGLDGTYQLSAAGSITLQKTVAIPFPVDLGELAPTSRPQSTVVSHTRQNPLELTINARGSIDARTVSQAVGSLLSTGRFVRSSQLPVSAYGADTTERMLSTVISSRMWKVYPRTFRLGLSNGGTAKRFYFGRALISITEDGGIVLQDAHGSQIAMAGGNIFISAQKDIIHTAGRNVVDVAGQDRAIRQGRHLDVSSAEGRVTVAASNSLTLVGGVSGAGGVHIESHGLNTENHGNPATDVGGITVRSKLGFFVQCPLISLRARGERPASIPDTNGAGSAKASGPGVILLDSDNGIEWQAKFAETYGSFGASLTFVTPAQVVALGHSSNVFSGSVYSHQSIGGSRILQRVVASDDLTKYTTAIRSQFATYADRVLDRPFHGGEFDAGTTFNTSYDDHSATWLSTSDFGLTVTVTFEFPVPEWQNRIAEHVEDGSPFFSTPIPDLRLKPDTSPLPGNAAWTVEARALASGYVTSDLLSVPSLNTTTDTVAKSLKRSW